MTTLRNPQCVVLTNHPMRTICGKAGDSLGGITLERLGRLSQINGNPEQDDIRVPLCVTCREVARKVVDAALGE